MVTVHHSCMNTLTTLERAEHCMNESTVPINPRGQLPNGRRLVRLRKTMATGILFMAFAGGVVFGGLLFLAVALLYVGGRIF